LGLLPYSFLRGGSARLWLLSHAWLIAGIVSFAGGSQAVVSGLPLGQLYLSQALMGIMASLGKLNHLVDYFGL
jgi:hypothetical protein